MDSRFRGNTYCTEQDFKRALISLRKVISFWRVATLVPWAIRVFNSRSFAVKSSSPTTNTLYLITYPPSSPSNSLINFTF
jgi:hypothetical protein